MSRRSRATRANKELEQSLEQVMEFRAAIQGISQQLLQFENFVASIDQGKITDSVIIQLQLRNDQIEPLYSKFHGLKVKLDCFPEHCLDLDYVNEFSDNYFRVVTTAKQLLSNKIDTNETKIHPQFEKSINVNDQVRLQRINIQSFDGKFTEWVSFKDTFTALVHNNNQISKVAKFHQLKWALKGEARKVVENIQASADNYDVVWDLLLERFENKRLLIHHHIKSIFDLPSITKESYSALRQISDDLIKNLRALEILNEPVQHWGSLIIFVITNKFDQKTKKAFEEFSSKGEIPDINYLKVFLKQRCELLEKLEITQGQFKQLKIESKPSQFQSSPKYKSNHYAYASFHQSICPLCKGAHAIYQCDTFLNTPVNSRLSQIKSLNLCVNCLKPNHNSKECKSDHTCKKCNKKHNTLLHFEQISNHSRKEPQSSPIIASNHLESPSTTHTTFIQSAQDTLSNHTSKASKQASTSTQILLSTAVVQIQGKYGNRVTGRCLLDSGSQSNFITEELCQKLKLEPYQINTAIKGINSSVQRVHHGVNISLSSLQNNNFKFDLTCLVLPKITESIPCFPFDKNKVNIPFNIKLADPSFNKPNKIDILIGASTFWGLLVTGQISLGKNQPVLQKSKLGWLISGPIINTTYIDNPKPTPLLIHCSCSADDNLTHQLKKFWQLDEPQSNRTYLSPEEQICESYFKDTIERDCQGRFVVRIPFNENLSRLGESRSSALKRFFNTENKLDRHPELKQKYKEFINEYQRLNHMSKIDEGQTDMEHCYYFPHHAVINEASLTTKLRVVFDGSHKTTTGLSINDTQLIGSCMQSDLFSIILRFRLHSLVLVADVEKMYRQVLVNSNDRKFQRIFWRNNPSDQLECFELNTITYGTSSAPYLATRCLHELGEINKSQNPVACRVIQNDFYMDDLITGADSISELIDIQRDVSNILLSAGFPLRKYISNSLEVLSSVQENQISEIDMLTLGKDVNAKTLGVIWNASQDTIQFTIKEFKETTVNKRSILSTISTVFDPLGLVSPVVLLVKLIIQELWKLGLSWEESIPSSLYTQWSEIKNKLHILNELKIHRHALLPNPKFIEIHGFSDSSEKAYGACIFIRSIDSLDNVTVNLLCAKSKVAPLAKTTLPRLELCSALLLAQLVNKVKNSLSIPIDKIYYWSDSTITLNWIKSSPHKFKTFVANRIADIQNLTNANEWHHVSSADNPADIISRGMKPQDLLSSVLWWKGPTWLIQSQSTWPTNVLKDKNPVGQISEEMKQSLVSMNSELLSINTNLALTTINLNSELELYRIYSSLVKLQRIVAFCLRFKTNCLSSKENRSIGPLSVSELEGALGKLIKMAQLQDFKSEINRIQTQTLNKKNHLVSLTPFLDTDGILRVGGRLSHSSYQYHKKHPIILHAKHPLTELIVRSEHKRLLHCGPQMLLASIRERFWPIGGRDLIRKVIHNCVTCFRANPRTINPLMGQLPKERVNITSVFHTVGVDYGGPFMIKDRKGRGAKKIKAYVCLFVCFATKAIHLDLVSDLSTEAFIATLRRFIARRGKPAKMYSDNGSNFVGAISELKELSKFLQNVDNQNMIINTLSQENINWSFIPPRAPNFGGLWEAGIKSSKFHIKRVLGNALMSFDEFYTVLTQIESILNSRPLCSLSSNPNDLSPLTPGHFLIGKPITSIPDPSLTDVPESRLSKYQRIQRLTQHFWNRWSKEYISELQSRIKWRQSYPNFLKRDAVVLIKEENVPPLKWHLGRVMETHPGADGIIRVATVKTGNSLVKRSVNKLCVLPVANDADNLNSV